MTDIHTIEEEDLEVNEENIDEDIDIGTIREDLKNIDIEEYTPTEEEIERLSDVVDELRELSGDYLERVEGELDGKNIGETSKQAITGFLIEALIKTELSTIIMAITPEETRGKIIDEVKEEALETGNIREEIEEAKENLSDEEREKLEGILEEIDKESA